MQYFGTLGPNFNKIEDIVRARKLGLNGLRINLSHSNLKDINRWLDNAKRSDEIFQEKLKILIDIKGMEKRIKVLEDFYVKKEDKVIFRSDIDCHERQIVYISSEVANSLELADRISIDDGNIVFELIEKNGGDFVFLALNSYQLKNNKSVSIVGKYLPSSNISDEDLENIRYSKKYKIDGFMLPFVRNRKDVDSFKKLLESMDINDHVIYSKIEDEIGVKNLHEIIEVSDVIVIARGDLGNNCGILKVSPIQKQISKICKNKNKSFMVVTQLLNSMVDNPKPTRAELNDIYNSSLDGADYLMLTAETAVGKYPLEAIYYLVEASKI